MRTRVGLVFGGRSGEHEISVRSAGNVVCAIDHDRFDLVPIAISETGRWLGPHASFRLLSEDAQGLLDLSSFSEAGEVGIFGDPRAHGLTLTGGDQGPLANLRLDVVLPVLHGTFGEDGTIQGLLDLAGIPYVGCGVLASACGMDKVVMKSLFRDAGLPMCRYVWFLRGEWERDQAKIIKNVESTLGYPCFAKPANLGSSVGISRADDAASLIAAIDLAARYDRRIIVEEGLRMREIECAVLGNDDAKASLPGEYIIKDKSKAFLDYAEKYAGTGNNEFVVPAPVSAELASKIQEMAIAAFKAIDGSGLARVDFFLRSDTGSLLINEINTMPGLTDASGYPKMWAGSGLPFRDVLAQLIEFAQERFKDRARNQTSLTAVADQGPRSE
ncbi:MAG: D-alanine--D-alanine ligase [Acidobacteria bacterium]|nr:D-alanine--D-alanine ligase [Acidobacteriota bacterium]